jgi:predicted O-methyltransferase YrrM
MDLAYLTSPEAKKFIEQNKDVPVEELLLRERKKNSVHTPMLIAQIEGRSKAQKKLPSWSMVPDLIYPVKLSMEQCSSERTASYKAGLVSGSLLADLTGGFGVDTAAFAQAVEEVVYVEQNEELAAIAAHNFLQLGQDNIRVVTGASELFLQQSSDAFDWLYIDPARRKEGNKVVRFADCTPDITALTTLFWEKTKGVLVKTSPLMDIDQAVRELSCVKEVHIVAVDNECKELLFVLDQNAAENSLKLTAVNIRSSKPTEVFSFYKTEEQEAEVAYHAPQKYLYEPNAALLKAGAFKLPAVRMGLYKLHASSHLYTSEQLAENFQGRVFEVYDQVKYTKKDLQAALPEGRANITVRNFPDSVADIRKKTGLRDGGDVYIFATRDWQQKPVLLLTRKV